jgi:hypothetical protein
MQILSRGTWIELLLGDKTVTALLCDALSINTYKQENLILALLSQGFVR